MFEYEIINNAYGIKLEQINLWAREGWKVISVQWQHVTGYENLPTTLLLERQTKQPYIKSPDDW